MQSVFEQLCRKKRISAGKAPASKKSFIKKDDKRIK
jgi:hypothetical protein